MRIAFATLFLVLLALYAVSFFIPLPTVISELRYYLERLALYVYLTLLAVFSISTIVERLRRNTNLTTSEIIAEQMKAHIYITRIVSFAVLIGFPLLIYMNWSREWGLSDAVMVAIPATLLALAISEQNIYTYATTRMERFGIEQARATAVYQIVDTIRKNPLRKGRPNEDDVRELESRFEAWELQTAEPNFAKFAAQARQTLRAIDRNAAAEVWNNFLDSVHADLKESVDRSL